jgi:membrane-bound lytic murein transglycosylase C
MGKRFFARCLMLIAAAALVSCATSKIVGKNVQLVAAGQPMDKTGLKEAVASDTKDAEVTLQVLKKKFAEALAVLKTNVQKRWGQNDTRVADKTVYVKYTQGYKSRVITDFDHGSLTVETLEDNKPEESLKTAIVAALLTSNNPATVDLFSDKEVALDPARKPYLFGLVRDNHGKFISTREQAVQYAAFLVPQKVQTRQVAGEQGGKTSRYVQILMVKNFEAKGAEHYRGTAEKYATQYHVSPSLVLAIIRTESNFNPFAVSAVPAYGLMQLVPTSGGREAYKRVQGVDQTPTPEYLFDPEHSIELGAAYLGVLDNNEFRGIDSQVSRDYCVIAAYNTGPRNVTRAFAPDKKQALTDMNHLDPPALFDRLRTNLPYEETRVYVVKVTGYRKQFVGEAAAERAEH